MFVSMMAVFVLFFVDHIIISSSATTNPSNSGSIRYEKSLDDVYIRVLRQGTAYLYDLFWSKHPGLLRPKGRFSVAMYEKYGYYEGYSEGLPGSEEFNVSAVPYGCFFHVAQYLDIYANLGSIHTAYFTSPSSNDLSYRSSQGGCPEGVLVPPGDMYGCMDKYRCMVAMSRGYNSYIHKNQVALCSDKCSTTRFNSTCPPVALHQGYRAHKTCNCSDDGLNKQELNCDDNIVRAKDNSSLPQVSVASLHSYKCVISNRQELAPFFVKRRSASRHRLTVIILSNLLVGDRAHDRVVLQQSLCGDSDDNHRLIINYETPIDLSFFGYQNATSPQRHMRSEVEELLNQDMLSFYSNSVGYENPTIMTISDVFVGIVIYDTILIDQGIFTALQLHYWILKESVCLHNKGSDVVVVIGNGDAQFNRMIHNSYRSHYKRADQSHKLLVISIHSRSDADLRSTQLNASEYTGVVMMRSVDMMRIDLDITRNYNINTHTYESTVLL